MVLKQVKPCEELITAKEETHFVPKGEGVILAKRRSVTIPMPLISLKILFNILELNMLRSDITSFMS